MRAGKVKPIVNKTVSGKFSFKLDYTDREEVATTFMSFIETESVNLLSIRIEKAIDRHLFFNTALEFFTYKLKLVGARRYEKFLLTRSEAICFITIMEATHSMTLKDVRAKLHQLLS